MASREEAPKVNAGSMADIAFLLLIFFLVTTSIEADAGLNRMLPRIPDKNVLPPVVAEKNILSILINAEEELLVENEIVHLGQLRRIAMEFLDNGGAKIGDDGYCGYCQGLRDPKSSDSPIKAVMSLTSSRQTSYEVYITVQNELVGAYNELRNREAQRLFGIDFTTIEARYANSEAPKHVKEDLKKKIKEIQDLFPMKLSEAELLN